MAVSVYTPANALTSPDVNQQTNFRVLVKMAAASNGQLRVTFRTGGGGSGLGIEGAAIGKWDGLILTSAACDMTTPPHRLMFAGLVEKLIPPNSTFTTDWVTHSNFALAAGDWLIITFKTNYDGYEVYSTGPTNTNVTTAFKSTSTDHSQAQTALAMGNGISLTGNKQPGDAGGYNFDIDLVETNDPSGGSSTPFKVWNGTSWVSKPAKVWSGSAWVSKPVKVWSGTAWITKGDGATGPWTPAEITTDMFGWWDPSIAASLTWSGANLLEMADQSPANRKMGRAAGSGPIATTLNGLGALQYTWGQYLMTAANASFNDWTIFAVFKPEGQPGDYERIMDHVYGAGWWFGRTGNTQTWGGGVMEGPPNYGIFVPLVSGEIHQISNVREGSTHRISGNGGAVSTSNAVTAAATTSNRVYLGDDNGGLSAIIGIIAEIIVWSRALSADEMAKTEGYLAWKWGIQAKLPAAHPYKAYAPGMAPEATAPTDWLLTSFTPGAGRNDFTGQVGVRYGIAGADLTVTWLGTFCGAGSGTRTVHICEWFTDVLLRTVTVDMAGQTIGTWVWTAIEPLTLLANGYYSVLQEVTASDGLQWSNADVNAIAIAGSEISTLYSCYRVPGGGPNANTVNAMYVGLDLGWN